MHKRLRAIAIVSLVWLLSATAASNAVSVASDRQTTNPGQRPPVPPSHPDNPEYWYTLAKAYADRAITTEAEARTWVMQALEADDWALLLNPMYYEALRLKDDLLRRRATYEQDSEPRKKLIAEADAIKLKADEIKSRNERGG